MCKICAHVKWGRGEWPNRAKAAERSAADFTSYLRHIHLSCRTLTEDWQLPADNAIGSSPQHTAGGLPLGGFTALENPSNKPVPLPVGSGFSLEATYADFTAAKPNNSLFRAAPSNPSLVFEWGISSHGIDGEELRGKFLHSPRRPVDSSFLLEAGWNIPLNLRWWIDTSGRQFCQLLSLFVYGVQFQSNWSCEIGKNKKNAIKLKTWKIQSVVRLKPGQNIGVQCALSAYLVQWPPDLRLVPHSGALFWKKN